MNKIHLCFLVWLCIPGILYAETINVQGHAFYRDSSDHSGIKILFNRMAPSIAVDSTYTAMDGFYSIQVETGVYDIIYSRENIIFSVIGKPIYSATILDDVYLGTKTTLWHVPGDFPTIQNAIDNPTVVNHDTVLVAPGTYYENINFKGKNIVLASNFLTTRDTTFISLTIIDGNKNGRVVTFNHNEDISAQLCGFTIQNGYLSQDNDPLKEGGGWILCNSSPSISNLIVRNNYSFNHGGGIRCTENSTAKLEYITINNNETYDLGGGLFSFSSMNFHNISVIDNIAGYHGGGIWIAAYNMITMDSLLVSGNSPGGMYFHAPVTIKNSKIINNINKDRDGGGIYMERDDCELNLFNVTIANNYAYNGGGIYYNFGEKSSFDYARTGYIENCIIRDNIAEKAGGGIYFQKGKVIRNSVIYNNSSPLGAGIYYFEGENGQGRYSPTVVNSIITGNKGSYGIAGENYPPTVLNSDVWNNEKGNFINCKPYTGVNVTMNANGDFCDAYGNISFDPHFVNTANGDFRLIEQSKCIDAGLSFYKVGYDTLLNFPPQNIVGLRPDIGVYESSGVPLIVSEYPSLASLKINNFPNPFNPSTTISFTIPEIAPVSLSVYSITGQKVATLVDETMSAGTHQAVFDGSNLSSGLYFYRLESAGFAETGKMLLVK